MSDALCCQAPTGIPAQPASSALLRVHRLPPLRPLPGGVDAFFYGLLGWFRRLPWQRHHLAQKVAHLDGYTASLATLTDAALQARLHEHRAAFALDAVRAAGDWGPVLAVLSEAAWRSLAMRPFPVQMMGALALHDGLLAEMSTGEGKTLVAGLAAVLAAWHRKPCHVVTANDYLAARDAQMMAPLYTFCGVTVASVTSDMPPEERIRNYQADVVYITAKELLGDFLRDRLAVRRSQGAAKVPLHRWLGVENQRTEPLLQVRGLYAALVDEADSVLIDEAETALILSAPRENQGSSEAVQIVCAVADTLQEQVDYQIIVKKRIIHLHPTACARLAEVADQLPPLWRAAARREELLRQALVARTFFKRDHNYVIQDDKIMLLDEYTGRMTPNRTLMAGLHQAIEAREGLEISDVAETLAQMSFQGFFRQFPQLAGMTGTCREAVDEFWRIYSLAGLAIPTNRPVIRQVGKPLVFATEEEKWQGIVAVIEVLHAKGCPILIGTRSVRASERLAERLRSRGLTFELLNAVRHHDEARIIAGAGELGRVTIATNMAGRGTDIKLGPGAVERGGLHVIITEIHDAGRIDRQLLGRCGRQGDPGSVHIFLSLDDDLARRFWPEPVRNFLKALVRRRIWGGIYLVRFGFRLAQRKAEQQAFQRRRNVLQMDRWLESALPFE
ncbi:MAG: hypothetical protein HQL87_05300 [Magnetococcales bacterium]|nr:hypothetical protein [Magnetococcales bacterium]